MTEIHNSSPKTAARLLTPASAPHFLVPDLPRPAIDLSGGDTIYEAHAVCAYHQPRVPGYCL